MCLQELILLPVGRDSKSKSVSDSQLCFRLCVGVLQLVLIPLSNTCVSRSELTLLSRMYI